MMTIKCDGTIMTIMTISLIILIKIIYRHHLTGMNSLLWPSLLGLQDTLTASLQKDKMSPNECPRYDTKQSDGEA